MNLIYFGIVHDFNGVRKRMDNLRFFKMFSVTIYMYYEMKNKQ